MRVPPSDLFLGICLGTVAGYVDTAGFVALYGLFTAHVTGNFVLIGATLSHPSHTTLLLKCLAFPAFGAGVVATRLLGNSCERKGTVPIRPMLSMQLVLLIAFMATALLAVPFAGPDAPLVLLTGMLGAAAMGVHNAVGKLQFSRIAPTTVMTGNTTELLIDMTDILTGHATPAAKEKFVRFVWPVLAFAIGCILGGAGYAHFGFWCLLAPIAAVALLLTFSWPVPNPAHV